MTELINLLEREIPEGRQDLQENFSNLEKVAEYCQKNYLEAADKKKALEETKNFTTHSLASVAYQINNLATNFLKLLDLQQNQLAEMESNVNHLAQTVNIHKEKVARREIGVLTTNRSTTRPLGVKNGIIFPEHGERPTKYQRKNIDYTQLDDVGHGVKLPDAQGIITSNTTPASSGPSGQTSSRHGSVSSDHRVGAPSHQPPTPPQVRGNQGSIGRAQGQQMQQQGPYRTPAPAVAPPTVPGNYASMQQMQQQQQQRGSISSIPYAPGTPPVMMGSTQGPPGMMGVIRAPGGGGMMPPNQPPVGVSHPMSHTPQMGPPPPSPGGMMPGGRISQQMPRQSSIDNLPPPPMSPNAINTSPARTESFDEGPPPPPPPQFEDDGDIDLPPQEEDPYAATGPEMFASSVPSVYVEKVFAIYDYEADKEDELSFKENSVIYVLKKNDDGWYEGVLNGNTGLFPGNYVEGCL